jgi:hypothetical protein
MNLDEYKAYVIATRKQATQEAMSVLSAKINETTKEGNK